MLGLICLFGNGWGMSWKLCVLRPPIKPKCWSFRMQPACLGVPSPSVQSLPSPSLRVCTYWCTFTCRPKFLAPVGHFRVFLGLCVKTRLSAQPLISKWFVILMQIKLISMRKVEYLASFFGTPRWCIRKGLKICHLHISHNTTCLPPPRPPPPKKKNHKYCPQFILGSL